MTDNILTRKWAEKITCTEFNDEAWEDIEKLIKAVVEEIIKGKDIPVMSLLYVHIVWLGVTQLANKAEMLMG